MFERNSRYFGIETGELILPGPSGERRVRYVRRRFVSGSDSAAAPVSHAVLQGERPDHLAARYFGDPTRFWLICDANGALRPDDLVDEPGRRIDIPLPKGL